MSVAILTIMIFSGTVLFSSDAFFAGLPVFFLWTVFSVFLISAVMWVVYLTDADNDSDPEVLKERGHSDS